MASMAVDISGMVNEIREATIVYVNNLIERDKAKPPIKNLGRFGQSKYLDCPSCGYTFDEAGGACEVLDESIPFDFCPNCGQRILYEEEQK